VRLGSLPLVLSIARQDLRLTLRDRSSIFWVFIAPFIWVFLFGTLTRPSDPTKTRIGLTVLQQETTPMAERLVEGLRAENFDVKTIPPGGSVPTGDEAPARTLTIPAGFQESIAQRRKVQLDLREGKNANPEGTFAVQVALHKASVRLLADEALGGFSPGDDTVRVRASYAGNARIVPSGYYQTIPGNLVMFVLIAAVTYGASQIATERKNGILRRLSAAPLRKSELIAGKLLGRVAVALVQVGVFLLIGLTIFRISWGTSPAGLVLLLAAYLLSAAAIGLLGGTLFASPDAASGVGIVVVLVMAAMGGCWWPAEVMPRWLQTAAYIFPTGWAMNGLHELLSWGGGLREVGLHCAVLALFALGAGALAAHRLKPVA